jgi:hypothetical protein
MPGYCEELVVDRKKGSRSQTRRSSSMEGDIVDSLEDVQYAV